MKDDDVNDDEADEEEEEEGGKRHLFQYTEKLKHLEKRKRSFSYVIKIYSIGIDFCTCWRKYKLKLFLNYNTAMKLEPRNGIELKFPTQTGCYYLGKKASNKYELTRIFRPMLTGDFNGC